MTTYIATGAVDELHTDDGGLVLLAARLVRLGPIGSVIRETAATPSTVSQFADALISHFGVPDGDVRALTQDAVDALTAEGLLAVVDG